MSCSLIKFPGRTPAFFQRTFATQVFLRVLRIINWKLAHVRYQTVLIFQEEHDGRICTRIGPKKFSSDKSVTFHLESTFAVAIFGFPDLKTFGVCFVWGHGWVWEVLAYPRTILRPKTMFFGKCSQDLQVRHWLGHFLCRIRKCNFGRLPSTLKLMVWHFVDFVHFVTMFHHVLLKINWWRCDIRDQREKIRGYRSDQVPRKTLGEQSWKYPPNFLNSYPLVTETKVGIKSRECDIG